MSFVYRRELPVGSWAVGFYTPTGHWERESTHSSEDKAAERVHWLNGGQTRQEQLQNNRIMENLTHALRNMPASMRVRF